MVFVKYKELLPLSAIHLHIKMNTKDLIILELEETNEPLLDEILDFVRFLKVKQTQSALENQQDLKDSMRALMESEEKGTISLEAFKTELGF